VKNYVLVISLFLLSLTPAYAATSAGWICQVSSIPIRYEVRKNKLLGYENDLTGKPNTYAIRINTAKKLVAARIFNRRRVTITIDKPSRRFLEVMTIRKYREASSGNCAPLTSAK
jgi:hypothetical protein